MQSTEHRYVSFPLNLLSRTITEPETAMQEITSFAILNHSRHTQPEDDRQALRQLLYVVARRPDEPLPDEIVSVINRYDIADISEAYGEAFVGTGQMDEDYVNEILSDVKLDEDDKQAVVTWYSETAAAKHLGRAVKGWDAMRRTADKIQLLIDNHEVRHGPEPDAWASMPLSVMADAERGRIDMRLFRMLAAVRSIVGRKRFATTSKAMLQARCIGGKNPAIAQAMAGESEAIGREYRDMQSRKRFDRILAQGDIQRGFYACFGSEKKRRIFIATSLSHSELATAVLDADKQRARRQDAIKARQLIDGVSA